MENFECSDYIFDSNFDSGNLGKVEFFKEHKNPHHIKSECFVNKEFNLWTSPDCSGWIYENTNRTWFYFGIKGNFSLLYLFLVFEVTQIFFIYIKKNLFA